MGQRTKTNTSCFRESEGIELDKTTIQKNGDDGFGQNYISICVTEYNNPKRNMIAEPEDFFRFLATAGIEVTNLVLADDVTIWFTWKYAEEEENMPVTRINRSVCDDRGTTQTLGLSGRVEGKGKLLRHIPSYTFKIVGNHRP